MPIASPSELKRASQYLMVQDPVLAVIIKQVGPCTIVPHKNYYQALCDAIISQQLSVRAAATIESRFKDLFGSKDFPPAEAILTKDIEELRSAGLSGAKANYIRDLAQHIVDGKLKFDKFNQQSNQEIITTLLDVKGIGEWTAHMFLMFCMGRLDVLPIGDLGIRNGVSKLYGLKKVPTPEQVTKLAKRNHWSPYESVASWYVWQSLKNTPVV